MPKDPICGMDVDAATGLTAEHEGTTYYFCCERCRERFRNQGGRVLAEPASCCCGPVVSLDIGTARRYSSAEMSSSAGKYICPMCPGVESEGPAACPTCGMALEPAGLTVDPEPARDELFEMLRRLKVAAALSVPVFLLAMLPMMGLPVDRWVGGPEVSRWLQLLLTLPVIFWAGWPFFVRGWRSLVTWNLNMFTLITLGVAAAFGYSTIAVLWPSAIPTAFQHHGRPAIYFEAAAMITTLVLLGQVLELRAGGAPAARSANCSHSRPRSPASSNKDRIGKYRSSRSAWAIDSRSSPARRSPSTAKSCREKAPSTNR